MCGAIVRKSVCAPSCCCAVCTMRVLFTASTASICCQVCVASPLVLYQYWQLKLLPCTLGFDSLQQQTTQFSADNFNFK